MWQSPTVSHFGRDDSQGSECHGWQPCGTEPHMFTINIERHTTAPRAAAKGIIEHDIDTSELLEIDFIMFLCLLDTITHQQLQGNPDIHTCRTQIIILVLWQ